MLLEALSDAWGGNGPLAFVADWRAALAGFEERPAALIYCAALVAIVILMFAGPAGGAAISADDSFRPTKAL
jgi:hypothetical protein